MKRSPALAHLSSTRFAPLWDWRRFCQTSTKGTKLVHRLSSRPRERLCSSHTGLTHTFRTNWRAEWDLVEGWVVSSEWRFQRWSHKDSRNCCGQWSCALAYWRLRLPPSQCCSWRWRCWWCWSCCCGRYDWRFRFRAHFAYSWAQRFCRGLRSRTRGVGKQTPVDKFAATVPASVCTRQPSWKRSLRTLCLADDRIC